MIAYQYKEGKAVFVNNDKRFISDNAALVLKYFDNYLNAVYADLGIVVKWPMLPSDDEMYQAITHPGIIALRKELGDGEVCVLLFNNVIIVVLANRREVKANEAETRSFFNLPL